MVIQGDARLLPLANESAQLCITSPPYWGLRNYGTGRWEGGVPFCRHGEKDGNRLERDATQPDAGPPQRDGYKKGRVDYGTNSYPSIGYEKLVTRAGFGTRSSCSCGAIWLDPAIGLEASLEGYLHEIVAVFREVKRVLRKDGLLFLNIGDKYDTTTNQLLGIPWRVALALQSDGWYLRSDIIWHKPNPMPEALVTKRCTTSHEYLFMFSKCGMDYYWDGKAIEEKVVEDRHSCGAGYKRTRGKSYTDVDGNVHSLDDPWEAMKMQPGGSGIRGNQSWGQYTIGAGKGPEMRNKRDVWTITVEHSPEAHYATFPQALVLPCILAGSRMGDVIFDPFGGTSTVGYVAERLGRKWATTELSWDYCLAAKRRTAQLGLFK